MLNQLKTVIILGLLGGLLLGVGYLFGGETGLFIALTVSVIMNVGVYWFSDRIVLAMYGAKEIKTTDNKELHSMIDEVVRLAKIPKPKVYLVNSDNLNAFATGRSPSHASIAYTTGILSALTKEELKGVTAHELSHVKNRDTLVTTIAATIAGVISYLSHFALFFSGGDDDNKNIFAVLLLAILTPIIATLLQLALSRAREYFADETGAKIIRNPHALASALEKLGRGNQNNPMEKGTPATSSLFIVNPFSGSGLMSLLSTHPPLHERIKRLKNMKV